VCPSGLFEELEAEVLLDDAIRVVAVPSEAWRPFFAGLVLEHHTFACSNLAEARRRLTEVARCGVQEIHLPRPTPPHPLQARHSDRAEPGHRRVPRIS
jgi:hypothetical protein